MTAPARIKAVFRRDRAAERVVPATGYTAALTFVSAAAMAFLAVFAMALALGASHLADRWESALAGAATVRLTVADGEASAETEAVLELLSRTDGVDRARALSRDDQAALLSPWIGAEVPLDIVDLPVLIDVAETREGPDRAALAAALDTVSPGAVYDAHDRWRAPFHAAASRLRALSLISLALIGVVMSATIALAASAALAANGQIVDVLRLVGAKDAWITRAFVQRFTLRTLIGAAGGTVLAMMVLALSPGSREAGFLGEIGPRGWEWLLPLLIPPVAAALALGATHIATTRRLRKVS